MSVNNDAVSFNVDVELSWYILGNQFAELSDEDQFQFLAGMLNSIEHWEAPIKNLYQLDAIVALFDDHKPDQKPKLANWLSDFKDRLELPATKQDQSSSDE